MTSRRAIVAGTIVGVVLSGGQATAQITPPANWEGAYDSTTRTRFIPLELILGAHWNGGRDLTLPAGRFVESIWRGSATWTGPKAWRHRDTGESLMVYDRIRPGVSQKMAVRREGDAIGRVEDSRHNSTCDQEAKFPLGRWTQGETRTYEYPCWFGPDHDRRRIAFVVTITIEDIDFIHGGAAHSLRVRWVLKRKHDGREMDHKLYVFSPGLSLVSAQ